MDIQQIKQVVDLMKRSGLSDFEIECEGLKLKLSRSNGLSMGSVAMQPVVTHMAQATQPAPVTSSVVTEDKNIHTIKSPMVGTFYASPSPDSPAFVQIGSKVSASTPICIIEAMKVMNEIQAETTGTIVEILVQNGQNIEYGQPLFKVNIG